MLESKDLDFINKKGIELNSFKSHIHNFKKGFPHSILDSAATIGNGILRFTDQEANALVDFFNTHSAERATLKFVPASGAASRMFKHLFEYRDQLSDNCTNKALTDEGFNSVAYFFKHLNEFAFFSDLEDLMKENEHNLVECLENKNHKVIIDQLLNIEGLQYASLPKALLKFHNYDDCARFAIEEHLVEGAVYCKNAANEVNIHFTVSPEHQEKFTEAIGVVKEKYEKKFGVRFNINFSIQKPSTDMIAVDLQNEPIRDIKGDLVFRPGGHGALIENLNDLDGDIIFVKNIDNIVPDRLRETTYTHKKIIAAHLIKVQQKAFKYLDELRANPSLSVDKVSKIKLFAKDELFIDLKEIDKTEDLSEFLIKKLNRPIRVCGMVKNEGEPGGGPFWVLNDLGEKSLQIVESSQINLDDQAQKNIVNKATHFNPVDLVCGVRDYRGNKFNLKDFIDPQTGFISKKSQNGKELKAQELPGLWNGAMANWISIFVECPIITFNPVKIINDLLREQHQ